ncbi:MAG: Dabb family protein [Dehalococcoidales bacterium]
MIKHVVMWKLKDFAEGNTKAENAWKMKSLLEGLKDSIKGIRRIEVGLNTNTSNAIDPFDIVLCAEFNNIEDLKVYQNHPEHMKVGDFIGKVRLERKVVDYEV